MFGGDDTSVIDPPDAEVSARSVVTPTATKPTVGVHDATIVNGVLRQPSLRLLSQVLS